MGIPELLIGAAIIGEIGLVTYIAVRVRRRRQAVRRRLNSVTHDPYMEWDHTPEGLRVNRVVRFEPLRRRRGFEPDHGHADYLAPEVTSEDHCEYCGQYVGHDLDCPAVILATMFDEGEPLNAPPPPNVGGEGNPAYQGPHYPFEGPRLVPYDMLHDPIPGTAVVPDEGK